VPKHRTALWKRALFHALKTLVRQHPRAAFGAAAAGASYAVKDIAKTGQKALSEGIGQGIDMDESVSVEKARAEFVRSLHPEDKRILLDSARQNKS
jgi:hypothetical protein